MNVYEEYQKLNSQIDEIAKFISPYVRGVGSQRFAPGTPQEIIDKDEEMIKLKKKSRELEFILLSM